MYEWRTTLWRQGSIVEPSDAVSLGLINPDEIHTSLVIIASHDCDLTRPPEIEPVVEFIVGNVINKIDGNCADAKTARRLHTTVIGQSTLYVEFQAPRKSVIAKNHFEKINPSKTYSLSVDDLRTYQYWLGSRYYRSAFPDEFEDRLQSSKLAKAISEAVRPGGEDILAVLFNLDDGEDITRNGDDDLYKLDIYILYASESNEGRAFNSATNAVVRVQKAFEQRLLHPTNSWKKIELVSCEAISDAAMPYLVFRRLKRWRLDYLSLADVPQQEVAQN
ncbi:hypothetical protein [Methylophilus aquaticus]|uniref:Uncharacterized protein n=1 Tax=Methylophilus aquaticus TaxID=1971610 RepID=A0ABT9JNV7_9PROT|nr:hypothetical protein [Methylophilus aquaticus]MDP8566280.1 hypothetical protein [Methylophilus aquaticus]